MAIALVSRSGVVMVPTGFSWTTMVFGFVPSLAKGHFRFAAATIAFDLVGMYVSIFIFRGLDEFLIPLAARIIVASIRNAHLHKFLFRNGWIVGPTASITKLPINDPE